MQRDIICDTHDCKSYSLSLVAEGLPTDLYVYKVLSALRRIRWGELQAFPGTSTLAFEIYSCNV
jgi:hypothetical protein